MREQCRWNQDIYQGYVQALSSALATDVPKEGWSIDNLDRALLSSADNRVSGLLLKNISGEVVTTFGKTRNGIPMMSILETGKVVPQFISGNGRDGGSYGDKTFLNRCSIVVDGFR